MCDFFAHLLKFFASDILLQKEENEMLKKKYYLHLTYEEQRIVLKSLIDMKNELINQGRYTDPVDELIIKILSM